MLLVTQKMKFVDAFPDGLLVYDPEEKKKIDVLEKYQLDEGTEFIRKGITPSDLKFDEGERAVIAYITTNTKDRDNEIVEPSGALLDDYRKNPIVLFGHNYRDLPIGKNLWIKADKKGLIAKTQYANHDIADRIYQYRKDGFPMAQSIGFIPVVVEDYDENHDEWRKNGVRRRYKKWILLEYSDVPVPSNPDALQIAVSKGLVPPEKINDYVIVPIDLSEIEKGVIPFRDYGIAPEDAEWNAAAEVRQADVETLKKMCAWFAGDGENKSDYKLPHHKASGNNPAVWNGVAAAMKALFGARGGVQIPDSDRKGVYNHLAKHYKQFDKEVPEFKEYTEEELKEMFAFLEEDDITGKEEDELDLEGLSEHDISQVKALIETLKTTKPGWDETNTSFRYRVRNPDLFVDGSFRTVPIKRDKPRVNAVMGKLKEDQQKMVIQSLIFPKEDEWTMEKAKRWLSEHGDLLKDVIDGVVKEVMEMFYAPDEEKVGRVLSSKNKEIIKRAVSAMQEAVSALEALLASVESDDNTDDEKAVVVELDDTPNPHAREIADVDEKMISDVVAKEVKEMTKEVIRGALQRTILRMRGRVVTGDA